MTQSMFPFISPSAESTLRPALQSLVVTGTKKPIGSPFRRSKDSTVTRRRAVCTSAASISGEIPQRANQPEPHPSPCPSANRVRDS